MIRRDTSMSTYLFMHLFTFEFLLINIYYFNKGEKKITWLKLMARNNSVHSIARCESISLPNNSNSLFSLSCRNVIMAIENSVNHPHNGYWKHVLMLINSVNHSLHLSCISHNLSCINVNQLSQPPPTSQP